MTGGGLLLAIETATRRTTAALGDRAGRCIAVEMEETPYRHGATLLEAIDRLLQRAGATLGDLRGVCVGTGPGSFTGLRVGLATAKVLAYSLDVPIVGVPTPVALASRVLRGSSAAVAVVLPAGAADLYVAHVARSADGHPALVSPPDLVVAGGALAAAVGDHIPIAVDLPADTVGNEAAVRGGEAQDRLGETTLASGAAMLEGGRRDDVATLVPTYVALPRGVQRAAEEMAWSPDLR